MNTNDIFNQKVNDRLPPNEKYGDYRIENSREARIIAQPKAGTDKERILRCIRNSNNPIHARAIAQAIDLEYHTIQRRLSELVGMDLIEPCGKVKVSIGGNELSYTIFKAL